MHAWQSYKRTHPLAHPTTRVSSFPRPQNPSGNFFVSRCLSKINAVSKMWSTTPEFLCAAGKMAIVGGAFGFPWESAGMTPMNSATRTSGSSPQLSMHLWEKMLRVIVVGCQAERTHGLARADHVPVQLEASVVAADPYPAGRDLEGGVRHRQRVRRRRDTHTTAIPRLDQHR